MVVRRIGILSAGKVLGCLYALAGLLMGAFVSLFAVAGASLAKDGSGPAAVALGAGAVILLPLAYGICGFLAGIISAALYNLVASITGGIEIDVRQSEFPQ